MVTAGIGGAAGTLLGCSDDRSRALPGRIIVVGAGPAGMTAAHLLRQRGVDTRVLEAAPTHGGRIRHDLDFADFPISLGAEWVHVEADILDEAVNDESVEVMTELVSYQPEDQVAYYDGALTMAPLEPGVFDGDLKFKGSSWLDFFDTYIRPGIADALVFDTQVVEIDHSGDVVVLTDASGGTHEAAGVIVTVPLRILQRGDITFVPALEPARLAAIDDAVVWSGLKAFFQFDEPFYPAAVAFEDSVTAAGQRLFYDAAYGQDTDQHILGLFSVGAQAETYQAQSDDEFLDGVLTELDEVFDGAASKSYVRHLVLNWNDEPFAAGAYLEDDAPPGISATLAKPLSDRVQFAGDAYTEFEDWSSVHAAIRSAAATVQRMLG
jgi:monoamine oxidase